MSWESAFELHCQARSNLAEVVSDLLTIAGDKPNANVLTDQLENLITELLSHLEEMEAHSLIIIKSKLPAQTEQVKNNLCDIHALINRFTENYINQLNRYDFITKLLEMGLERGREWREWSQEIKTAIERCFPFLNKTSETLMPCWNELTQKMAQGAVSMQSINIGQQINLREDQLELASPVT